ncbi:glycosyltransferase family 2 protein [Pedobacter sp. D749]|uniref:glycosyltransferase family 2 protein n=1 Tax=Pedobacter sp. D749 TaxID=2856523 RepID=UPI001C58F847|nr:glycosyltransferase family 2 protein [Pedobacter sp. D749]QXU41678.1 glycosyltransferase [Pedobacter sp. D749]
MLKNNCLISIVVPFYNVDLYFDFFLESLLPLDDNFEIILVDDGSKDNSINIAQKFSNLYNNVKILSKENGGLSSARNYGLKYASGEHVIFLDSDDYIEDKNVLFKMYEKAKSTHADIVLATYYEFSDLKVKKFRYDRTNFIHDLIFLDDRLNKLMDNDVSFAVWNKMFKVDFLIKNKLLFKEGIWFEDLEFIYRAFFYANKISKVDDVLLGYRQRLGSIMKTITPKILDKIFVLNDLLIFLEKQNLLNRFYEKFKILYIRMAFSVIYAVVMNEGKNDEKRTIINTIFNSSFFLTIFSEELLFKGNLTIAEKIFYHLIKYKIINRYNIVYLGFLQTKKN